MSPFWKGFCRGFSMPWTIITDRTAEIRRLQSENEVLRRERDMWKERLIECEGFPKWPTKDLLKPDICGCDGTPHIHSPVDGEVAK